MYLYRPIYLCKYILAPDNTGPGADKMHFPHGMMKLVISKVGYSLEKRKHF